MLNVFDVVSAVAAAYVLSAAAAYALSAAAAADCGPRCVSTARFNSNSSGSEGNWLSSRLAADEADCATSLLEDTYNNVAGRTA